MCHDSGGPTCPLFIVIELACARVEARHETYLGIRMSWAGDVAGHRREEVGVMLSFGSGSSNPCRAVT